jgi:hypothetical protein
VGFSDIPSRRALLRIAAGGRLSFKLSTPVGVFPRASVLSFFTSSLDQGWPARCLYFGWALRAPVLPIGDPGRFQAGCGTLKFSALSKRPTTKGQTGSDDESGKAVQLRLDSGRRILPAWRGHRSPVVPSPVNPSPASSDNRYAIQARRAGARHLCLKCQGCGRSLSCRALVETRIWSLYRIERAIIRERLTCIRRYF